MNSGGMAMLATVAGASRKQHQHQANSNAVWGWHARGQYRRGVATSGMEDNKNGVAVRGVVWGGEKKKHQAISCIAWQAGGVVTAVERACACWHVASAAVHRWPFLLNMRARGRRRGQYE